MSMCMTSCLIEEPKAQQTSFETMTVAKSDITVPVKYSAVLSGKIDATITPQIDGQLMKVCVTEGQRVKAGQTLFIIDSRQARLSLEDANANLQAAKAQESSAKLEYESNKNLFEKKIVSSYMLNTAKNDYNQAVAAVQQAQSAVNRAKVNLGYCNVTSPVSGIVGAIPVAQGEQVGPGITLTKVSGNGDVMAEFSVAEDVLADEAAAIKGKSWSEYLKTLPEVTFVQKDGKEYAQKGTMFSVTGMVDKTTGTVTCKAKFPNPQGLLFSGQQGTVVIPFSVKGVIVIPQTAVVKIQDKAIVYKVDKNNCAQSVIVTVVNVATGKDVVVTSGLNAGDKIVTVGANNVTEGQQVVFPEVKEQK